MSRPVIGVTTYWSPVSWGPWSDVTCCFVPGDYVAAVYEAGGRAVLLPPDEGTSELVERGVVQGMIFSGGEDIDPRLYGASREEATNPPNELRDRTELSLARTCLDLDLPVLGICRGGQLLNVARGGTLVQDLSSDHRPRPGTFARHEVILRDSKLREILGAEQVLVESSHHQGIDVPGAGLRAVAHAPDGAVEAVEDDSRDFCVGVVWHPEVNPSQPQQKLIAALVASAARAAGKE